jgi:hypothetical protein
MDHDQFKQAKVFIFTDVEREIHLAKADSSSLRCLGVTPGGGNFLAALGLLCYTEFAGKLRFNESGAAANFNRFFDLLGQPYKELRTKHNVYKILRCGLAHEYYVKQSCTIEMVAKDGGSGIREDPSGHFRFIVESYSRDLKRAFDDFELHRFGVVTR